MKYNTWFYGKAVSGSAYPWCCVFVCWCFHRAGLDKLIRRTGGCTTLMNWYKAKGRLVPIRQARPGDLVFYQFDADAYADHIGIVERVTQTGVVAIEGNTSVTSDDNGGAVMRRTRRWGLVMAVARPEYAAVAAAGSEKEEKRMTGEEIYRALRDYCAAQSLPQWAEEELREAVELGITDGSDPMGLVPRYQAAILATPPPRTGPPPRTRSNGGTPTPGPATRGCPPGRRGRSP